MLDSASSTSAIDFISPWGVDYPHYLTGMGVPVNSPIRNPGDRSRAGQDASAPRGGPLKLVRRLLHHRQDSAALTRMNSPGSLESAVGPKPSIVERLEGFFTRDLPSSMEVLPTQTQELSAPTCSETTEKSPSGAAEPKDSLSMPSEFATVRSIRLAAKDAIARSQDAYREIESNLKNHAQEFERRQEALSCAVESASANLRQLQVNIAKNLTEELEKASQALLAKSAQQLQEQADVAVGTLNEKLSAEKQRFVVETEKQFEELRASRQAFIEDTQKQLAAVARSSLDYLTKAAVEEARAELDASKQGVVSESQKELASIGRTSTEALAEELTKDLIEKIRAEVTVSRQGFIEATQDQLAKMTMAFLKEMQSLSKTSVEQADAHLTASRKQFIDEAPNQVAGMAQASLESAVKSSVEQGRKELSHMVDEFLVSGISQIEAEMKSLVNRRIEALRTRVAGMQTADVSQLTPVHRTPSQGHKLEFTLPGSAPQRRMGVSDVLAGLSWGLRLGLALGVVVLLMLAIYLSSSPVVRLRVKPPDAFFDTSPRLTAKQNAREDQLSRAYWDIAVQDIETKYGFGSTLPADPPDSFQVAEKGPSGAASKVDAAARTRYWEKLREVWPQSNSWERTSDWNLDWIRNAWDSVSSKITQVFSSSHTSAAPAH
jgi:hypothetical protein